MLNQVLSLLYNSIPSLLYRILLGIGGVDFSTYEKLTNMEMSSSMKQTVSTVLLPHQPENTQQMPQVLGQSSGGWPIILLCFC